MEERHEFEQLFKKQLNKFIKIYQLMHSDSKHSGDSGSGSLTDLSFSIGKSRGYISKIANPNNRQLPRMIHFFQMCEELNIHPKDFFNDREEHPEMISKIVERLYDLDKDQLNYLQLLIEDIAKNKNSQDKNNK